MLDKMNMKKVEVDAVINGLDTSKPVNNFKVMMLRDLKEVATATSKRYSKVTDYGRIAHVSAFIAITKKEIMRTNDIKVLDPLGYIILDVLDSLEY